MTTFPSFLRPVQQLNPVHSQPCVNAIFPHNSLGLSAHALWWPAIVTEPPVVVLFIPGNPGLVEFYTPFLTALHERSEGKLAVLAQAHLGHSPTASQGNAYKDASDIGLTAQVQSAIEAVDAIRSSFEKSKVVVVGHSMGSWITLQVLKARPDIVSSVFLLFPTITHISSTPNGRSLSWLFRSPLPRLISYASVFTRALPLRLLYTLFPDWPEAQVDVLRCLLNSPEAIYASLTLAHDEMTNIRELDIDLLQQYRHRMHLYFAETDDWVGEQKEVITKAFDADPGSLKVIHGQHDVPHAFCINHGDQLAQQCFEWLQGGEF